MMNVDERVIEPRRLTPLSWASKLSDVWDVGLVVLGSSGDVDFINGSARQLLGVEGDGDVEALWRELRPQLRDALEDVQMSGADAQVRTVRAGIGGPELRVQIYGIREADCHGHLVLLQRADRAAAVERALRDATRNSSLTSLSRDTAHELKDMLNAISMNVELLSRLAAVHSEEAQIKQATRCADVARREMRRLARSLDVVLDRSLVERNEQRPFDLKHICESLMLLIAPRAVRQHVRLESSLGDSIIEVVGFPDRVHSALLSVLINALDAMPDGGTLSLLVDRSPTLQVRVCDTGPGVPPEIVGDIFRLHFTTKTGGLGLGLFVARAAIEAQGGTIRYEPNDAGGSCFVVELPTGLR